MTVFSLLRADKKRWRRNSRRDQHGKIMTHDEAQISVNGNRGHHSITFSCFLYVCFCYRQGLSVPRLDLLSLRITEQICIR